jgi:hypothetical protein
MHRFNYVIAALAVVAFVSPSVAEDISKAGPTARTERSVPPGGEVKRDAAGGEIRGSGERAGLETRKGEPRWHHARAERVVIVDHRHHHYHHHDVM